MKIATWNVNSVRARLANIVHWIEEFSPDVIGVSVHNSGRFKPALEIT